MLYFLELWMDICEPDSVLTDTRLSEHAEPESASWKAAATAENLFVIQIFIFHLGDLNKGHPEHR